MNTVTRDHSNGSLLINFLNVKRVEKRMFIFCSSRISLYISIEQGCTQKIIQGSSNVQIQTHYLFLSIDFDNNKVAEEQQHIDSSVYKNIDIVHYKYLFWQHFETLSGKRIELIICQETHTHTHICEMEIEILETQGIGIQ